MEIGNIVGTSYINALADDDRHGDRADAAGDRHRHARRDRARPCSPSAPAAGDVALLLDSELVVEGEDCSIVVPAGARITGGVEQLLARLGL